MGIDVWILRSPIQRKIMNPTAGNIKNMPGHFDEGTLGALDQPNHFKSLEDIGLAVEQCKRCELHKTRTHTVVGNGKAKVDWMFVGEAPGQQEDQQGQPFVGKAGRLLDIMIAALGMQRQDVYVTNVLKCRPPNNRDPLHQEVEKCEYYLQSQLYAISPKIIITLGRISSQTLLRTSKSLGKIRGQVYRYGKLNTPLIPTYHPAYLLRSPEKKSRSWEDLWLAKSIVEEY